MNPLIDHALLVLALITAILIIRFTNGRQYPLLPSFFLLFAPFVIFYNMWAHTVAVAIVNYKRYLAGTFHFGFHLYSLVLFGVVFIAISGFNIHYARKVVNGQPEYKRKIHLINLVTALLFIPVFFVNPLGALPVIASALSSITLVSVKANLLGGLEGYTTASGK